MLLRALMQVGSSQLARRNRTAATPANKAYDNTSRAHKVFDEINEKRVEIELVLPAIYQRTTKCLSHLNLVLGFGGKKLWPLVYAYITVT